MNTTPATAPELRDFVEALGNQEGQLVHRLATMFFEAGDGAASATWAYAIYREEHANYFPEYMVITPAAWDEFARQLVGMVEYSIRNTA